MVRCTVFLDPLFNKPDMLVLTQYRAPACAKALAGKHENTLGNAPLDFSRLLWIVLGNTLFFISER